MDTSRGPSTVERNCPRCHERTEPSQESGRKSFASATDSGLAVVSDTQLSGDCRVIASRHMERYLACLFRATIARVRLTSVSAIQLYFIEFFSANEFGLIRSSLGQMERYKTERVIAAKSGE